MLSFPRLTRWGGAWLGLLLLCLTTLGASAAGPKRVLILDPFGRDVAPFSAVVSTFRTALEKELGASVDIYEIPLDLARFSGPEGETPLVAFLEGRLKVHPVDLVVPVGGAGARFAARYQERLFSHTPLLFAGSDPRLISPDLLQRDATLVVQKTILKGMVEDILQLQPQTNNIVVIFGASSLEQFWVNESRREFQAYADKIKFTWVNDLSEAQILERCATLPPHSFILHGLFLIDALGNPNEKNEMMRQLHEVANAPIFGIFESEFGLGSVGGHLYQDREVGRLGARAAIPILRGESAGSIPPTVLEAATPVYDWRELQRWGISEARLPAGSIIQFREPGYWERNRWMIAGGGLFILLQVALIIGLLVNRRHRLQGEAEASLVADISARYVNVLPADVDQEINASLRRICEFLDLDVAVLWQPSSEVPGTFGVTHLYQRPDAPAFPATLAQQDFPWTAQQLLAGRTTTIGSLDELPAEAATDGASARRAGIKSHVTLPLLVGGGMPIGLLGFNATRRERSWPAHLIKRLELIGQIFANALARKQADQALRESEQRMTLAAEAAQFGVWRWHVGSNRVWGSASWLRLFGFPAAEEVTYESNLQRIHRDDRATVDREVRRALTEKSAYHGEFRVVWPDGTVRWIVSRGQVHRDAGGQPDGMLGAAIDITSRKLADEQFRLVVEASPSAIVLIDREGRIVLVNAQTELIFGYARAELIGQELALLLPPRFRGGHSVYMAGFFAAPQTRAMGEGKELRALRKDGTECLVEIGLCQIQSLQGTLVLANIVDVTHRKRMEAELLRERAELAHVARVSTMGELAASVAHELNQPLAAILANAEAAELFLQQDPPAYGELRAILADIRKDDERAGEVIRRMRVLLRKHELEQHPLDLNELVQDVFQIISADAVLRGVVISLELGAELLLVSGDRIHLQQVLLNFILNGMDAMTNHPGALRKIVVRTRVGADGGVEVAVHDSGHGIGPDHLPQLFEPFFTTKPNGMGMGLSIARTIIEAHQGRIWAENKAGGGASFCFALPALPAER